MSLSPALSEPCDARPIRTLGVWDLGDGWRVKAHAILYRGLPLAPELVEAGKRLAREVLPRPAGARGDYGVGYVGLHQGRGFNVVFVDWWANENELFHRVFLSLEGRPFEFRPAGVDDIAACVWDVRVLAFERSAWLAHVLRAPAGRPDVEAYLSAGLDEEA